ncbi:MAG: bifunctional proline dehydrogenase/L-glutamate gamma-semialdehyde dehydrogenase PutA [Pseudomonadales bacterium]
MHTSQTAGILKLTPYTKDSRFVVIRWFTVFVADPFPEVDTLRLSLYNNHRRDEALVVNELLPLADISMTGRGRCRSHARKLIVGIREAQIGKVGVDALLNEFALSTEEGVVLMCLAEALLRVPDKLTVDRLIHDAFSSTDWASHLGNSDSLFVNASTWGLLLTGKLVNFFETRDNLLQHTAQQQTVQQKELTSLLKKTVTRLGEPVIRSAVRYALQIMGTQFVIGKTIHEAIERAQIEEVRGYRYSYDMLGEGARTMADADHYFQHYMDAIKAIGQAANHHGPVQSPGISVKLSAIHPRYEFSQRERVMAELVPRLTMLALAAKAFDIGFTVDAEEAERLDLSLDVIEAVFSDRNLSGWEGFGLAIQAYQKRALSVVEWVGEIAKKVGRKMVVRLVKGAYWDSEIKWSQEQGHSDYPVFTRKLATDVCYLACAKKLLAYRDILYPQFATHNAYTVATILEMDSADTARRHQGYEFQRLHGMGEALYDQLLANEGVPCRIYAPVGKHADLLAYLVRRLLENGANSSFVNSIVDESIPVDLLLEDPVEVLRGLSVKRNPVIPLPVDLYTLTRFEKGQRRNSLGADLADINTQLKLRDGLAGWWAAQLNWLSTGGLLSGHCGNQAVVNPADQHEIVGYLHYADSDTIEHKLAAAFTAVTGWSQTHVSERSALLRKLASDLEVHRDILIALCCKEAGKTIADAVVEIREAVDFCRYYADRAEELMAEGAFKPRGVIVCISPWNFPLAIFLGQIAAAIVTGNTVIAKPAEQTSLVATKVLQIMGECGFPEGVVALLISPGKPVGEQLLSDRRIQGVMFTGSTDTGHWLAKALVDHPETDIPLIAETGGQNAMIGRQTAVCTSLCRYPDPRVRLMNCGWIRAVYLAC